MVVSLPQYVKSPREIIDEDSMALTNPIIGIHGRMHVGKTTLADFIVEKCDRTLRRRSFADGVKDVARNMGWNGQKDQRGRRLLQLIGTECGRMCISESIWVDRWSAESARSLSQGVGTVCDDVRFENEVDSIRAGGGLLVKIRRPSVEPPPRRWWQFWRKPPHASERELPDDLFHLVFTNDGDITDLMRFAQRVATVIDRRFGRGPE